MATIQFYQALRISEAAALDWKSVRFNVESPSNSKLYVHQRVVYLRTKPCYIKQGLKNKKRKEPFKDLAMLKETYETLKALHSDGATGLIFPDPKTGKFFSYATVMNAYTRAFVRAGLPYTATHVMRHGGGRKVYNETGSDLEITKQALGNTSLQSVLVYAKRDVKAHAEYAARKWNEKSVVATGSKAP